MVKLIFEKVGDAQSEYPYLCVCFSEEKDPFMEISVSGARQMEFVIYPTKTELHLTLEDFNLILERGNLFLPEALENFDCGC